jgi:hypothetical protein
MEGFDITRISHCDWGGFVCEKADITRQRREGGNIKKKARDKTQ